MWNFYRYLSNVQQPRCVVDGAMISFYGQMIGVNIGVIHPGGIWSSSEDTSRHIYIVYKGSNKFMLTEPGKLNLVCRQIVTENSVVWDW